MVAILERATEEIRIHVNVCGNGVTMSAEVADNIHYQVYRLQELHKIWILLDVDACMGKTEVVTSARGATDRITKFIWNSDNRLGSGSCRRKVRSWFCGVG